MCLVCNGDEGRANKEAVGRKPWEWDMEQEKSQAVLLVCKIAHSQLKSHCFMIYSTTLLIFPYCASFFISKQFSKLWGDLCEQRKVPCNVCSSCFKHGFGGRNDNMPGNYMTSFHPLVSTPKCLNLHPLFNSFIVTVCDIVTKDRLPSGSQDFVIWPR